MNLKNCVRLMKFASRVVSCGTLRFERSPAQRGKIHAWNGGDSSYRHVIKEITSISVSPLLPEIQLHLITPACELWKCHPGLCPVPDPYWAFLWPGGHALSRFLLSKPDITRGKNVLDVGCGGGSSVIASLMSGANCVVANDIDPVAITAVEMNVELNCECSNSLKLGKLLYSNKNILPLVCDEGFDDLCLLEDLCREVNLPESLGFSSGNPFDVILIGDMFYDEDMVERLHFFLLALKKNSPATTILIGDPGRPQLLNQPLLKHMTVVAEYDLPESCTDENYGFTTAFAYEYF